LAFSNPAADGTIVVLKSQGNVTIAGTINGLVSVVLGTWLGRRSEPARVLRRGGRL
jgi:hypothetical protein